MKLFARAITALCAALAVATAASAQNAPAYPTRTVRIVVPYPAGGPTDVMARLVAQSLSESLGQSFVVENTSGASGVVGTVAVANSAGDGHTLLFVTNDFAVAPVVSSKVGYDAVKSFAPVSIVAVSPQVVVAHPSLPAKSMQELVAIAKAEPTKYNYASLGIGFGQLSSERLFRLGLGLDIVRVPFPGAAPIISSTLAGHTPIAFLGLPPAAPHIKQGTLRALAVTSPSRSPAFPTVPTMTESGVRNQDSELIIGLVAPAATPKPIIDLLQRQIVRIAALPEVKAKLDALGFAPVASTPETYAAQIKGDIETWSKVVRDAGIKVE
ncbi:MAG: tripartite tricarboxylate transporter substrate binding protein [Hyphomicrobiales bacterium]|nr:tripartite tricarboxylate transporter substrate binding protein [Hyphomicrobiales bacterium]